MKRNSNQKLINLVEYYNLINANFLLSDSPLNRNINNVTTSFNGTKLQKLEKLKKSIKIIKNCELKKNAKKHKVEKKINFINCDWAFIDQHYDLVVSNPPYLANKQYEDCEFNIKNFEPKLALVGGSDGLESYRQIAKKTCSMLHNHTYLFIEIGSLQTNDIRKIFAKKNLKIIRIVKDYQQIDRVLVLKYDSDKKKLA